MFVNLFNEKCHIIVKFTNKIKLFRLVLEMGKFTCMLYLVSQNILHNVIKMFNKSRHVFLTGNIPVLTLQLSWERAKQIEDGTVDAFLAMTIRLSENSFRPCFYKVCAIVIRFLQSSLINTF